MKTFPLVISDCLVEFRRLGLYSLEIESLLQAVNLFILLYMADTLTQLLLKVIIEYIYLEIEVTMLLLLYYIKT